MKVTLLGDSIREQYAPKVKEMLGEDFEVWYPRENCRFSKYTLRGLFEWTAAMAGSDIVHWNNGHWDICDLWGFGPFTSEEEFVTNMMQILDILQKRHKVIIFSTTTPVRSINKYNKNEVIERYNNLIIPLLKERGVIINDLNSLLKPDIDRYICQDTIHLSEEGIQLCAEQVTRYIKEAAERLAESATSAAATSDNPAPTDETGAPVLI